MTAKDLKNARTICLKKNSPRSLRHLTMNHLLKAERRNPAAFMFILLY